MAGVMPIILGSGINRVAASATISANTSNYVLNTGKAPGYSAGKTDMVLTISPGVYVSSSSTGSYALQVDTSWDVSDTVTIVNNGVIVGRGGGGGTGYNGVRATNGSSAGPALLVQRAITMNNLDRIAGGGGGGGGGAQGYANVAKSTFDAYGGGGGGGIGGASGGPGGSGTGAQPGAAGTVASAGSGGNGGSVGGFAFGGPGGSGGAYGSSGSSGSTGSPNPGGNNGTVGTGGAAGACIVGNSNITYTNTGTRNGSIS